MSSSTMLDPASYGECVAEHGGDRWRTAGLALLDALTVARGRVGLIAASDPAEADDLVRRLSSDLGIDVSRLGSTLADSAQLPSAGDVESAFGSTLITDLDLLMWP